MRLDALRSRWRRGQWLALVLRAIGVGLGAGALSWIVFSSLPGGFWGILLLSLAAAGGSFRLPHPPLADRPLMARHLDRALPQMEDSTDLMNRENETLTDLEILQKQRVSVSLAELSPTGLWPRAQIVGSLQVLAAGVLVLLLVAVGHARWSGSETSLADPLGPDATVVESEEDLLALVTVEIEPPDYTGLESTKQDHLDLDVLEGSKLRWLLPPAIQAAALVFSAQDPLAFEVGEEGSERVWVAKESDLYRLVARQGEKEIWSPYSRLEVIPDRAPTLEFTRPVERVTTVTDDALPLDLELTVNDDHGLRDVELVLTLAAGSGELVEFREQRRPLTFVTSNSSSILTRLDLAELGLESGSELYFHAEARDNREPEANIGRTGTFIVRHAASRAVSADLGDGIPIVLPPEYFRSQRQIILDTEKLIRERQSLSVSEFAGRSEALGFDQRALRMRYGTLLGEEFESGRPLEAGEEGDGSDEVHDHEGSEDEASTGAGEESELQKVVSEFAHLHDSGEIATFFTSEIRTQLKQVLAEMWDAEGRLRIHDPDEALPYEYRALELLKDLQQRSRIYVQKVGFETPPLELEKTRLTGELEDIRAQSRAIETEPLDRMEVAVRSLLADLEGTSPSATSFQGEDEARVRAALTRQAGREPETLQALEALDLWVAGSGLSLQQEEDLAAALWQLLPDPSLRAGRLPLSADPLFDLYRAALSEEVEP